MSSPPRVVIDMRQVTFMDSAGISLPITGRRATTQQHGWLRLAGVPNCVMRTLQSVELDTITNRDATLRDALHPWPPRPTTRASRSQPTGKPHRIGGTRGLTSQSRLTSHVSRLTSHG
ncbi:STAS domain-containing protein [Streptomyces sp. NPDC003480]